MSEAKLVVVLTAYKQPGLLAEAIKSILNQEIYIPWALVLVNDGCPFPETHELCLRVRRSHHDRVLYLRQQNKGDCAARNAGIELALRCFPSLRAIYILDGDDRLWPFALQHMYDVLEETGADWVFPDQSVFGTHGFLGMAGEYCVLENILGNYMTTCSLVNRAVFDAGVRFDDNLRLGFGDWDFWLQAARLGFRGRHVPAAGFLCRRRSQSLSSEAGRDFLEIGNYMQRKHSKWLTPRTIMNLEHDESPRYALIFHGEMDAVLCTDPRLRDRTVNCSEFLDRLARSYARSSFRKLPHYLVMTTREIISQLDEAGLLNSLLWHLESLAAHSASISMLTITRETDNRCVLQVQLAGDERFEANSSILVAMASVQTASLPGNIAPTYSSLFPKVVVNELSSFSGDDLLMALENLLTDFRKRCKAQINTPLLKLYDSGRRKASLTTGINELLKIKALFPIVTTTRSIGYAICDAWDDLTEKQITSFFVHARNEGFSTHLFWFLKGPPYQTDRYRMLVDTVTLISGEQLLKEDRSNSYKNLLGLLGAVDILINHECVELHTFYAQLRRWGTKIIYSICDRERKKWPAATDPFLSSIDYEYAIDGFAVGSESLAHSYIAHGVPESKIITDLQVKLANGAQPCPI